MGVDLFAASRQFVGNQSENSIFKWLVLIYLISKLLSKPFSPQIDMFTRTFDVQNFYLQFFLLPAYVYFFKADKIHLLTLPSSNLFHHLPMHSSIYYVCEKRADILRAHDTPLPRIKEMFPLAKS